MTCLNCKQASMKPVYGESVNITNIRKQGPADDFYLGGGESSFPHWIYIQSVTRKDTNVLIL